MSTYTKVTKHPQTGVYEQATWHDDYFGPHIYGVEFKSDKKTYPAELVETKQIYDFWADDVLIAFETLAKEYNWGIGQELQELNLVFLNQIQHEHNVRWKTDPVTGNGATEKSKILKKNQ